MKKCALLLLLCLLTGLLGGCFAQDSDDFLVAPKQPTEYVALQQQLAAILDTGAEYAAPETGQHRTTVQMEDLDGDGLEEVISFFRKSAGVSEFQVYLHKKIGDEYVLMGSVTGHGTAIEEVFYPVLGIDGQKGVAICWRLGDNVAKGMTVCAFTSGGELQAILDTEYTAYTLTDFDSDGAQELMTINRYSKQNTARLFHYDSNESKMTMTSEAALCQEAYSVAKVITGKTKSGLPAVFVDSTLENTSGMVTDVFTASNQSLVNLTIDVESNSGRKTYRMVSVNCDDVDNDGSVEIPLASLLPGYSAERMSEALWLLEWYDVDVDDLYEKSMLTYQNSAEEWMLRIPDTWVDLVTVQKKQEGEVCTEFSVYRPESTNIPLLEVYVFAGDDRQQLVSREGFFTLGETTSVIYAGRIPEEAAQSTLALTKKEARDLFSVIQHDWME